MRRLQCIRQAKTTSEASQRVAASDAHGIDTTESLRALVRIWAVASNAAFEPREISVCGGESATPRERIATEQQDSARGSDGIVPRSAIQALHRRRESRLEFGATAREVDVTCRERGVLERGADIAERERANRAR